MAWISNIGIRAWSLAVVFLPQPQRKGGGSVGRRRGYQGRAEEVCSGRTRESEKSQPPTVRRNTSERSEQEQEVVGGCRTRRKEEATDASCTWQLYSSSFNWEVERCGDLRHEVFKSERSRGEMFIFPRTTATVSEKKAAPLRSKISVWCTKRPNTVADLSELLTEGGRSATVREEAMLNGEERRHSRSAVVTGGVANCRRSRPEVECRVCRWPQAPAIVVFPAKKEEPKVEEKNAKKATPVPELLSVH